MSALYPVLIGLVVLVLYALAFLYLRWRSRRHRIARLRTPYGGIVQVEVLGPYKRGKGMSVRKGRAR